MNSMVTQLRGLRESLGATQEQVVRKTSITLRTYVRAEDGDPVTNKTARQILDAINEMLQEKGKPSVSMEELGLALY
jgi:DNA-binding XRE family transcriptional regulator